MSALLAAALRYAAAEWPVFPCLPGRKVPLFPNPHPKGSTDRDTCRGECGRDGHGVLDATIDPDRIAAWWARVPAANVAIATGFPGPDVVDVDVKDGRSGRASVKRLCEAGLLRGAHAIIVTPSGGFHLYFAGTDQGNGAAPRHGIDFRGSGGYVLAPPSAVADHRYRLADRRAQTGVAVDWQGIRRFLDPPSITAGRNLGSTHTAGHDGLIRHVAGQGEGNRNAALYWAACRALESNAGEGVLRQLVNAAISAGLPHNEAERTVQSAQRRARTA